MTLRTAGSRFRSVALIFAFVEPLGAAAQDPDPIDRNPEVVTVDVEVLKADVAAGVDVTAEHLFRVASISKSFTALAVLRAVEDGFFDLGSPVRELAPEVGFTNRWEGTHPITVAMLMEHTTGFDDLHFSETAKVDDPEITLAEGLAYHLHSRISRWQPGTYTSYSNSGPAIAAYVVEKITGQAFEDYVREHVFDPLGMESSTFHVPRDAALVAKGYEADGVSEVNYDHTIFRPSGGLSTSSREMARYLRMMINRGTLDGVRLLAPETITRMETPATTLAARAGFTSGRGLGNSTSIVNGHLFHGHNGGHPGFVSRSWYSADLGVGFFVSINNRSSYIEDIAKLLGERLTEGFETPRGAVAALSDDELRAMTGYHQNVTPRQQIEYAVRRFVAIQRVTLEEGKLFIAPPAGGEKRELVPVTARSFRYEDEPVASVLQVVNDEGNPILQVGRNANYRRVGAAWLFLQWAVAATTLMLLISALLFALVWAPAKIFGRMKTIPLRTVLFPLLASSSLVVWFLLPVLIVLIGTDQDMGTISGVSLSFFIGSLVFLALTALSLHASFRSYSVETGRFVRLHSRLVSLACFVASLYLWSHGWIGLRGWAY